MTKPSQKVIEKKWQKIWEEQKIFEPKLEKKKKKFFSTVPYPYANSVVHIGHGRGYTTPDIFTRYQRLLGKNVLFPMAYHISGTPVLAVADGISRGDKKQIKITRDAISDYVSDKKKQDDLLEKFKDPQEIALFFSNTIEESIKSIGISIDWTRQFTTGDDIYNKFIEWQYKKLEEVGILVQGKYPILYSSQDENAVGEDDIKDGDIDKVTLSEMKYIMFKFTDSKEYLVASTLRPDSLFGATNLFVKPDMRLVKLKVNGKIWVVSKASQVKVEHQFDNVEFISEHKAQEFIEKNVVVPILGKEVPIYPMEYPDENHGTGIVYSSPADSPHDYIYLFEIKFPNNLLSDFEEDPLKLTPITLTKDKKGNEIKYKSGIPAFDSLLKHKIHCVDGNTQKLEQAKEELYKEAHYGATMINCGEFDGTPLKNNFGANKVNIKLEELGLGGVFYETSRRAKTRGGDDVIVANLDGQWFLNYKEEKTKAKALELLNSMEFNPEKLRDSQKGYINWVEMRPCARKRGIGTPLPQDKDWIIEPLSDSTIYQKLYLIHHILVREKISPDKLTYDFFEYVFLGKGDPSKLSLPKKILDEMRAEVEYWKGFDFRYTAGAHMSNHLTFLIYHYALLFPKHLWPKNITIGGMLIKDGEKISKSKGNGIPLQRVGKEFGVDLYRLYIGLASNYDVEMDFKEDEIKQLEKKFNRFKDLIFQCISKKIKPYNSFSDTNKWLISKFYSRIEEYFEFFNNMRIREAYVSVLYEFLNDIMYHERRTSFGETLEVLRFIVKDYLIVMTPIIPHICEEFWEQLGEKGVVSLTEFTTKPQDFIDKKAQDIENIVQELVALIARNKETKNLSKVKSVSVIQASDERFKLFDDLSSLLKKTKNFKEIFSELMKNYKGEAKFIQKFVPKTLGSGLSAYLPKEKEKKLLGEVIPFLENEFETKITIVSNSEENPISIVPGKPGVVLE